MWGWTFHSNPTFPKAANTTLRVFPCGLPNFTASGLILIIPGMAFATTEPNSTPVSLVVTTHDPGCTAIFVAGRDGVALQTQIRPLPYRYSYTLNEITGGVSVTFAMPVYQADMLMPTLAGRGEVSSVTSYLAAEPPVLLANATNPNTRMPADADDQECNGDKLGLSLYRVAHMEIVRASGHPGPWDHVLDKEFLDYHGVTLPDGDATGSATSEAVAYVFISTGAGNAGPLAFLEENGVAINTAVDGTDGRLGFISAYVPLSLLGQLSELEQVASVEFPAISIPTVG